MPGAHIDTLTMQSPRLDGATQRQCPRCGAFVVRVPRRLRDRIISIARPVQRFQCVGFTCHWEGNLSLTSAPARDFDTPA